MSYYMMDTDAHIKRIFKLSSVENNCLFIRSCFGQNHAYWGKKLLNLLIVLWISSFRLTWFGLYSLMADGLRCISNLLSYWPMCCCRWSPCRRWRFI